MIEGRVISILSNTRKPWLNYWENSRRKSRMFSSSLKAPCFCDLSTRSVMFWCIVCHQDIDELESLFACGNAIKHLASSEHMACLKSFWSENGADVNKRDMYCISQQDFSKWENRCKEVQIVSTSRGENSLEDLNRIRAFRCLIKQIWDHLWLMWLLTVHARGVLHK